MKTSICLLASVLLAAGALADDQTRDVQAELKQQGFYYGEVDGKGGNETDAAVRRYQIRNGLQVSGKLNDETLESLGMKPAKTVPPVPRAESEAPAPVPKAKPVERPQLNPPTTDEIPAQRRPAPRPAPRPEPTPEEPPAPIHRPLPNDPAMVAPPRPIPPATYDDYSTFFQGSPYATAPREVQVDIVRKAQLFLGRRGVYKAAPDGVPGPATSEALFLFQFERKLNRSGRLDLPTLAEMQLLPGRSPDAPPLKPFFDPSRRKDRSVDYNSIRRL